MKGFYYHGTDGVTLAQIIKDGVIKPREKHNGFKTFASLPSHVYITLNLDSAICWGVVRRRRRELIFGVTSEVVVLKIPDEALDPKKIFDDPYGNEGDFMYAGEIKSFDFVKVTDRAILCAIKSEVGQHMVSG